MLVNNAGYGHAGALTASDLATQLGMIDLNVRALVELTHLLWDGMLARKRGGVLNVASTAAFQPGPLMAVYYASKAFVLSFSEALWEEARGTGVKVSCLCPGPTASRFRERAGTGKTRLATASAADALDARGRAGLSRLSGEPARRDHRRAQPRAGPARAVPAAPRRAAHGPPPAEPAELIRAVPAPVAALVGALLLGALSTFGDFVWARYVSSHRAVFGLAHGTLLLMAVGLYLGVLRGRAALGALAGALVGLLAAASFYALAPLLGYAAMFVSWMALWIGFASSTRAWAAASPFPAKSLVRGLLAAVGSGLAFWAISGIWTHPAPGGPRYAYNFLCWTLAFLPGFAALLLRGRNGRTSIEANVGSSGV